MANDTDRIITVADKPPIQKPMMFGIGVLVAFFGTFMLWSLLAPIESAAIAPGKITVDSSRKTIQHLEGGIIKKIYIREGSSVKKGDMLIKLDETQAKASMELLNGRRNELLAAEARLIAQRDNLQKPEFSPELTKQKDNAKVAGIMKSQVNIFNANMRSLQGHIDILKQRYSQLEKQIDSLNSQVNSESEQLKLIEEEITAVKYLEERKLIEKPRLLALQREAARLLGNRGEHLGLIAKAQQEIGETNMQILSTKDKFTKETLDELRDTQQKLADVEERFKAAEDVLLRTSIIAPQTGKVVGLLQHTIGGVVTPGEELLQIVPTDDLLVVEARVSPLDIDVVYKGLKAKIQLTAFKQRSTPTLNGFVEDISGDSFDDERTKESYYRAKIVIPKDELEGLKHVKLYPGMPAQVMIITDKRTAFNYFITPIKESFDRAFREQ